MGSVPVNHATIGPGKGPAGGGGGLYGFTPGGPGNVQNPNTPAGAAAWANGTNAMGQTTSASPPPNTGTWAGPGSANPGVTAGWAPGTSNTSGNVPAPPPNPFGTPTPTTDPSNPYNPNNLGGGSSQVQFGGVVGGANATAQGYGTLAGAALGTAAPTVDLSGANAYGNAAGAGLGLIGQTAVGGGPAEQAAQATLQQGTSSAINAGMALANSSRGGGPAGAAAQAGAIQNASSTAQQGGVAASNLQANMAATAQGQFETGAQGEQQALYGQQMGLAGLQQAQTAQNAQIAQGYYGMGNQAEQAQLGADSSVYANNLGLAGTAMQVGAQQQNSAISAGTGAGVGLLTALGSAAAAA